MNAAEAAWAAGLFEGEGCFTRTHQTRHPSITMKLSSTDQDVVERFRTTVGCGYISRRVPNGLGLKLNYVWQTEKFESVQYLIATFWSWLGSRRRARAKELLIEVAAVDYAAARRPRSLLSTMYPGKSAKELTTAESSSYQRAVRESQRSLGMRLPRVQRPGVKGSGVLSSLYPGRRIKDLSEVEFRIYRKECRDRQIIKPMVGG